MITDYNAMIKFINTLVTGYGLRLVLENTTMPRTDGTTIYVPAPSLNWSEEKYIGWQFFIYHELGHCEPAMRDCFQWMKDKGIGSNTPYGFLMNLLDDYRQEHYKYDEFEAKQKIMSAGRRIHTLPQLSNLSETKEKLDQIIKSLWLFDLNCRESWMRDLIGLSGANVDALDKPTRGYYDLLVAGDYRDELNEANTSIKLEVFLDRVLREVYNEKPEDWKKQAKELTKQQQAAGDGKPQKVAGKSGDGAGAAQGESDQDGGAKMPPEGMAKYEDLLAHKHDGSGYSVLLDGKGLEIDYSTYNDWGAYIPYDYYDNIESFSSPNITHKNAILAGDTSHLMASKVRKILQVKAQSRYEANHKSGRLHAKSFHKVMSPDQYRRRQIHRRKIDNTILDVAVSVLVDSSGSMSGEKYKHACRSALALNESISKIGVPLEIIGFTDRSVATHYIYKKFDQRLSNDQFASYLTDNCISMGGNADGESILFAYERLTKRKNKRKLLIVLSDGQPAGGQGDCYTYTRDLVKHIENDTPIEIYGIGIKSNSVKNIYAKNEVIQKSDELETVILRLIKNHILGV